MAKKPSTNAAPAGPGGGAQYKAAVKAARRDAIAADAPVAVDEYGIVVHPNGTTQPIDEYMRSGAVEAAKVAAGDAEPAKEPARGSVVREGPPPAPETAQAPLTPLSERVRELMSKDGFNEADAMRYALSEQVTGADFDGDGPKALPSSPGRPNESMLGPDPALVAQYHEKMASYVPPALEKTIKVTLQVRHFEWVERWAEWKSIQRGQRIDPERALEMMVREHWQMHAHERALLTGTRTGPQQAFDPKSGRFQ